MGSTTPTASYRMSTAPTTRVPPAYATTSAPDASLPPSEALVLRGTKIFPDLNMTVDLEQDHAAGVATIKLTGPSDVWFGVGFGALTMARRPYTIIVDGSMGTFHERRLDM